MAWKFTLRKGQEDRKSRKGARGRKSKGERSRRRRQLERSPPRDDLAGRSAEELERPSAAWLVRACALAR